MLGTRQPSTVLAAKYELDLQSASESLNVGHRCWSKTSKEIMVAER